MLKCAAVALILVTAMCSEKSHASYTQRDDSRIYVEKLRQINTMYPYGNSQPNNISSWTIPPHANVQSSENKHEAQETQVWSRREWPEVTEITSYALSTAKTAEAKTADSCNNALKRKNRGKNSKKRRVHTSKKQHKQLVILTRVSAFLQKPKKALLFGVKNNNNKPLPQNQLVLSFDSFDNEQFSCSNTIVEIDAKHMETKKSKEEIRFFSSCAFETISP